MPEAALAIPAAALPFEVVPTADACEPLEFLAELISDGLNRHQNLSRTLAASVIDSAENCVRIGWALDDAKSYLTQPGSYQKWMAAHFGQVSSGWLLRLRKLSAAFSRDLLDVKQRERLGITVEGLPAVTSSVHLRTQLADAAPRSLNHLFRMTGVLPAAPSDANGGKKGAHPRGLKAALSDLKEHVRTLEDLERALGATASALVRIDLCTLSLDESTELMNHLQPFVEYHRGLLVRIL
jgi:hypothetical protein